MTTEVTLRQILDRKQWEMVSYAPVASTVASCIASSTLADQLQFLLTSATALYIYDPYQDGWLTAPSPALAGTYGSGTCTKHHPHGPRSTATAGTTTTITTSLSLQRSLRGYTVRIIAGPNAGTEAIIKSNTTGTNSVITVETPFGTAITSASEFILMTGRLWMLNAGTLAAGSFKYYDIALNTSTNGVQTGLPGTPGTDGRLISTAGVTFVTGTATGGTSTTLVNSAKTWTVNNWANNQVRITAGTGAGQFRTIASNTATTLTVATAWTTIPDATSVYAIEGNDDYIYYMGNGAVALYRYSISATTWTTLSPGVARGGAPVIGASGHWISGITDSAWLNENAYLNGQYIYSFRGGGSSIVDRYNINTNAWENDLLYSPKGGETILNAGNGYTYIGNNLYIMLGNTGRLIKYNITDQRLEPCSQFFYAQGTALTGDRMFDVAYTDGATTLRWIYFMSHSQATVFRMLVF